MSTTFPVHTLESSPKKAKPALQALEQALGIIPNLAATMASSPTLLNCFVAAFSNFHGGTFDAKERQALLLTNAVANRSEWAIAFHSTFALKEGVAPADVQAIRQNRLPADARLAALVELDRALLERRGAASEAQLAAFGAAGFSPEQAPRNDRGRRRIGDGQLRRQRHPAAAGARVSGASLSNLKTP